MIKLLSLSLILFATPAWAQSGLSQIGGWGATPKEQSESSEEREIVEEQSSSATPVAAGESDPPMNEVDPDEARRERLRKADEKNKKLREQRAQNRAARREADEQHKKDRELYRELCGLGTRNAGNPKCHQLRTVIHKLKYARSGALAEKRRTGRREQQAEQESKPSSQNQ